MGRGLSQIPLVSFSGGELSPRLDARVDMEKYISGCRQLQNATVYTYGGWTRRPGTQFIAEAKFSNRKCRLMDFQFSRTTTFTLEVGHQYIRFYSNGAPILSGGSVYEIVSPYFEEDIFDIQIAQINDVAYLVHPRVPVFKLSRLADNDWSLEEVIFDVPAFLYENISDVTITPGAVTGTDITFTASDGIFKNGHLGSYWQIGHSRNADSTELEISANGTSSSLRVLGDWNVRTFGVWAATILIQRSSDDTNWTTIRKFVGDRDRNVDAVGREDSESYLRIKIEDYDTSSGSPAPRVVLEAVDSIVYGLIKITAILGSNNTQVEATVIRDLHSTAATEIWSEPAWSNVRGFPSSVTIFEQRMFYAGTLDQPQTIWGSVVGDYENFQRGSNDDQSFAYTLGATERNAIEWLVAQSALMIGTSGGEWSMSAGRSGEEPLSPTNVLVRRQSTYGSRGIQAQVVNEVVLFVQRTGRKVREMVFSFERDGFVAPDMTLLSEHITEGGIVNVAYQQQDDSIFWAITGNGRLIGMTYERDQNVVAWHRHVTEGEFESVAAVYGSGSDEIWVSVKRVVNGVTKRYIERFNPVKWEEKEDAFFVDSGLSYNGSPETVFGGLSHLEGKVVSILADGAPEPNKVVSGGSVSISSPASVVHVGLPYETVFEPMRLDSDQSAGLSIAKEKRIRSVVVRFIDTLGLQWSDGEEEFDLSFRDTADLMDSAPPLFSGDKLIEWSGNFTTDPRLILKQVQPLPMTVLAVIPKYEITGK